MKILIVEDDPTAGLMIESLLRSLGHETLLVTDAAHALLALRKEKIRIVVSDWQMEGIDGLSLCEAIRSTPGDYIYFMLITQREPSEENETLAIEAGVDDFLTKPVLVREMRSRLHVAERILGYTRKLKQLEEILPICGYCHKVRNDQNYWDQLETYVAERTGSKFSHGICPDCYNREIIPQLDELTSESSP